MNWFFIAILAPIFWSANTHFDKFILSKYGKGRGVGSVFLFSTFFSLFFAAAIFVLKHTEIILYSNSQNFFLFLIPGFLNAFGLYFYLKSLKTEESSVVVALFQLSPVFAYFLGYIFLGKVLIKWEMICFILLSALFFAFNDVLFKKFTIYGGSFAVSLFWQHFGIFIIGISFFLFLKNFREDFFSLIKMNRIKIFLLNGFSEFFYVLGNLISNFATLLAPVALILVVNTYQTVFTFIIGISLTLFFPHIITEKISSRHLLQRMLAIVIILIGSYFLY